MAYEDLKKEWEASQAQKAQEGLGGPNGDGNMVTEASPGEMVPAPSIEAKTLGEDPIGDIAMGRMPFADTEHLDAYKKSAISASPAGVATPIPSSRPVDEFSGTSTYERPEDPFVLPSPPVAVKSDGSDKPTDKMTILIAQANGVPVSATNGQTVETAYQKVKIEDKEDAAAALDAAIKAGDRDRATRIVAGMVTADSFNAAEDYKFKKAYAFGRGFLNAAASNAAVVQNNSPEKLDNVSIQASADADRQFVQSDIRNHASVWTTVKGILPTLVPFVYTYEGTSMAGIMKENMPENYKKGMPLAQHRLDDMEYFRGYIGTLREDQGAKEVRRVYEGIKAKHGDFVAAMWYSEFMNPDKEYLLNTNIKFDSFVKALDGVGLVLDATVVGGLISKIPRVANAVTRILETVKNPMKSTAIKSGQARTVIEDAAKALTKNADGAIVTKTEAADDALTVGVGRRMPGESAVNSGAIKEAQYKELLKAADNLDAQLFKGTITKAEHQASAAKLLEQQKDLAGSANSLVHSAQLSEDGKTLLVLNKPAGRENWITKEAAEAWARNRGDDFVVVPDTANVHVGLSAEMRKNYEEIAKAQELIIAQRLGMDAAELVAQTEKGRAEILSEIQGALKERSPNALPKELATVIPTLRSGNIQIPIKFATEEDKVAWALTSGKIKNKAPWEKWAKDNGHSLEELSKRADTLKAEAFSVSAADWRSKGFVDLTKVPDLRDTPGIPKRRLDGIDALHVITDRKVGFAGFSKSVPKEVEDVANSIVSRFGLQDTIAFISANDVKLSKAEMDWIARQQAAGKKAVHMPVWDDPFYAAKSPYNSAILIIGDATGKGSRGRAVMSDIVSAIGEAHIYNYGWQNADLIYNLFKAHSAEKGLSKISSLEFADLWRLTNGGVSQKMVEEGAKYGYSVEKYLAANPETARLFKTWTDWYGTNFSRYAFASAEPDSVVGKIFYAMGEGVRKIVEFFTKMVGREVSNLEADANIAKFLRDFEKKAKELSPIDNLDLTRSYLLDKADDLKYADAVDAYVDAKRALAADAENADQLVTGWLVARKVDATKVKYQDISGFAINPELDRDHGKITGLLTRPIMATLKAVSSRFGAPKEMYQANMTRLLANSGVKKKIDKHIKEIENSLDAKQMDSLNEILDIGDTERKVFSPEDIAIKLDKYGMSPQQINDVVDAYGKQRFWEDYLWKINDEAQSSYLTRSGYMRVEMKAIDLPEVSTIAKPLVDDSMVISQSTVARLRDSGERAWHVQDGRWVTIDDAFESKNFSKVGDVFRSKVMIFEGHVAEEIPAAGGELGKARLYISEPNKTFTGEIHNVMPYREGSYRRYYTSPYFVEVTSDTAIGGVTQSLTRAIHTAETRKAGDEFVKILNEAAGMHENGQPATEIATAIEKRLANFNNFNVDEFVSDLVVGRFGSAPKFSVRYMNTNEDWIKTTRQGLSEKFGGRARGENILTSIEGKQNTMLPFEAMRREATNLLDSGGMYEWAAEQINRTVNTFRHVLPAELRNLDAVDVYNHFEKNGMQFVGSAKSDVARAERAFKEIQRVVNTDDKTTAYVRFLTTRAGEFLEDFGLPSKWISGKDPIGGARAITFHAMLGLFNIAQLPLQAASIATAAALHPIHGLSAMRKYASMRIAMTSDDPAVWAKFAKADWAAMKSSRMGVGGKNLAEHTEDYVATMAALKKSGLIDDIGGTTIYGSGRSASQGRLAKSISKGANMLVVPFNEGEKINRMVSFMVARDEWIDAAKKAGNNAKWFEADNMRTILGRADDYMFNMTSANKSALNQGLAGIPMQFQQYSYNVAMSVMSSIIGRGPFSKKEMAKIAAGAGVVFGVPVAGHDETRNLVDTFFGSGSYDSLPEDARTTIESGLVGVFTKNIFGSVTDLSERASILNTYNKFIDDWENKYNKGVLQYAIGPAYSVGEKALAFAGEIGADVWRSGQLSGDDVLSAAAKSAPITSLRNSTRAYLAQNNMNVLRNKQGTDVIKLKDEEIVAKYFGFGSMAELKYYENVSDEKKQKSDLKEIGDELWKIEQEIVTARINGDKKREEDLNIRAKVLYHGIKPSEFESVLRSLRSKRMKSLKGTQEEQLKMREAKVEAKAWMDESQD